MDSCGEEHSGYIASCPSSGVASHLSVSFVIITKGEKFGFCPSSHSAALPPAQPALTRWGRGGPSRGSLWRRSCHWYTSPWLGPPAEGSCSPSSGLPRINGPFPPCGLSHLAPFLCLFCWSYMVLLPSPQLCLYSLFPCHLSYLPWTLIGILHFVSLSLRSAHSVLHKLLCDSTVLKIHKTRI